MADDPKILQLLEQLPLSHPMTFCTTASMSFLWFLSALPTLSPAFIAPENNTNGTGYQSIQREFNLESEDSWLHPAELTSSVFFLGNLVLGQIPCVLADSLGRRPIVVFSTFLLGLAGVLASAAPTFYILLAFRFLQGATFNAMIMINWVLCCESLAPRAHKIAAIIFGIFWVLGYVAMAGMARYSATWRQIQLFSSLPSLLFAIFIYWRLPESPAFLATKGLGNKLKQFITRANNRKKNPIKCNVQETIASLPHAGNGSIKSTLKNIINDNATLIHLASQTVIWTCDFLLYGVMMLTTDIGFDPCVSFMLSGLAELPCYIAIPYLLDWFGRRPCVIGVHLLSGLAYACLIVFPDTSPWWLCLWLLAKFGIASAFQCCFVYGVEIFPVENRNICLGVCSTIANLGAFLSPHVDVLDFVYPGGAFLTFSALCLVCAGCTTLLPETGPGSQSENKKKISI